MKIFTEGMLFKVDGSLSLTEYAAHSYLDLDYMNCYSILISLVPCQFTLPLALTAESTHCHA